MSLPRSLLKRIQNAKGRSRNMSVGKKARRDCRWKRSTTGFHIVFQSRVGLSTAFERANHPEARAQYSPTIWTNVPDLVKGSYTVEELAKSSWATGRGDCNTLLERLYLPQDAMGIRLRLPKCRQPKRERLRFATTPTKYPLIQNQSPTSSK